MAQKSEMYVKYGQTTYFWDKYEYECKVSINKNFTINDPKKGRLEHAFSNSYNFFDLKLIHGWKSVRFRICLAPKNHGYSILAQSYECGPRQRKLDILDFTLSRMLPIPKARNLSGIITNIFFLVLINCIHCLLGPTKYYFYKT